LGYLDPLGAEKAARRSAAMAAGEAEAFGGSWGAARPWNES